MVNVPPYCGVPRLSHQFPVAAVVVVAVVAVVSMVAVDVVDTVVGGVETVVDTVVVVVEEIGVVAVLHDDNISDVTKRTLINTKIIPLFIETSYFNNTFNKLI